MSEVGRETLLMAIDALTGLDWSVQSESTLRRP